MTIDQARQADQQVWLRVAEQCRSGVRPGQDGKFPIEVALVSFMSNPAVTLLLVPARATPGDRSAGSAAGDQGHRHTPQSDTRLDKANKRIANLQQEITNMKKQRTNTPNGKGGGKGKGRARVSCPRELVGKQTFTDGNDPICR